METQKFYFFKLKLNFDLYFDSCQRPEIVQVGFNMKLYDDIGDASSFRRRSTSSLNNSGVGLMHARRVRHLC